MQNNVISTQHYAEFSQKKLIPRTAINGIKFSFEDLSEDSSLKSLRDLMALIEVKINLWKSDPLYSNDYRYKKNLDHLEELKTGLQKELGS